jgi:2'-5' RNA ligase
MNRYFIAAIPPAYLANYITGIKQSIAEKYDSKAALNQPPHITLVPPFQLEDSKINRVSKVIAECLQMNTTPFLITLENYSSFPPKVIFMQVVSNSKLIKLASDVNKVLYSEGLIKSFDYDLHPHVTVAFKDLTEENYKLAWEEYKDKNVYFDWDLNQLSVLKYVDKQWVVVKDVYYFFGYTDNGNLRFPKGIAIRDYE